MRKRTKPFFDSIIAECENQDIDFGKFLAYMGRRYYQDGTSSHFDSEKAKVFDNIYQGKNPYDNKKLSAQQGVFLKKSLDIGRRRYTVLRKFLNPYVHLPKNEDVRAEEKNIVPKFDPCNLSSNGLTGLWCPLPRLLEKHTTDLMENSINGIDDSDSPLLDQIVNDGITIRAGGGFDASGRHSTWRYTVVCNFSYLFFYKMYEKL